MFHSNYSIHSQLLEQRIDFSKNREGAFVAAYDPSCKKITPLPSPARTNSHSIKLGVVAIKINHFLQEMARNPAVHFTNSQKQILKENLEALNDKIDRHNYFFIHTVAGRVISNIALIFSFGKCKLALSKIQIELLSSIATLPNNPEPAAINENPSPSGHPRVPPYASPLASFCPPASQDGPSNAAKPFAAAPNEAPCIPFAPIDSQQMQAPARPAAAPTFNASLPNQIKNSLLAPSAHHVQKFASQQPNAFRANQDAATHLPANDRKWADTLFYQKEEGQDDAWMRNVCENRNWQVVPYKPLQQRHATSEKIQDIAKKQLSTAPAEDEEWEMIAGNTSYIPESGDGKNWVRLICNNFHGNTAPQISNGSVFSRMWHNVSAALQPVFQSCASTCSSLKSCIEGEPERKKQMYAAVLQNMLHALYAEFDVPHSEKFWTADDDRTAEAGRDALLEKIYQQCRLFSSKTEDEVKYVHAMTQICGALFKLHSDPTLQDPNARRFIIMKQMDEICQTRSYQDEMQQAKNTQQISPRLRFLHTLAQSVFNTPIYDQMQYMVQDALAEFSDNEHSFYTMSESGVHPSIKELTKRDAHMIQNCSANKKLNKVQAKLESLKGEFPALGMAPMYTVNIGNALYNEVWLDRSSNKKIYVPLQRMGTPTIDDALSGSTNEGYDPAIIGALHMEIDRLELQGEAHIYVGHQRPPQEASWIHSFKPPAEGMRTQKIYELSKKRPESFIALNLPLDGAFFTRHGKEAMSVEGFCKEVFNAFINSDISLPKSAIENRARRNDPEFHLEPFLHELLQDIDNQYFSHIAPTAPEKSWTEWVGSFIAPNPTDSLKQRMLSPDEQNIFLTMFYAKLSSRLSLVLNAKRNHTCKDAIDRAAIVSSANFLLHTHAMGNIQNSHYVKNLRVLINGPALCIKGRAMLEGRLLYINRLVEFLEKHPPRPEAKTFHNLELVDVVPAISKRPLDVFTAPNQAPNAKEYLLSLASEHPNECIQAFPDTWAESYLLENADAMQNKVVGITFMDAQDHISEANLWLQTARDFGCMQYYINGQIIAMPEEFKGPDLQIDDPRKASFLYKQILRATNDAAMAHKLFQFSNQSVFPDILQTLMAHYKTEHAVTQIMPHSNGQTSDTTLQIIQIDEKTFRLQASSTYRLQVYDNNMDFFEENSTFSTKAMFSVDFENREGAIVQKQAVCSWEPWKQRIL